MKKTLICLTASAGLLATAANADMPTMGTASYSGQYKITTNGQPPLYSDINAKPGKQRMAMTTSQGTMVTVLDMLAKTGVSYNADPNSSMGNMAISVDFKQFEDQLGPDTQDAQLMTEIGSSVVAGQVCTLYQHPDNITACVTSDGIMMKTISVDGGMEMTSLTRGFQDDSLFTLPAGYQVMNLGGMMSGGMTPGMGSPTGSTETETDSRFQTILENEAEKRTKNEIEDQTRKQMGNTVGGAVGGGLIGSAVGGEAGKAAKDLVGGLFGKKKKKKKKDAEKVE